MNLSANPFEAGWYVADSMFYTIFLQKQFELISNKINCRLLSETSCSGNPCRANISHNTSIVLTAVVVFIIVTSGHFEWTSMVTKKNCHKNGPAKFTWILLHCESGQIHDEVGL